MGSVNINDVDVKVCYVSPQDKLIMFSAIVYLTTESAVEGKLSQHVETSLYYFDSVFSTHQYQ